MQRATKLWSIFGGSLITQREKRAIQLAVRQVSVIDNNFLRQGIYILINVKLCAIAYTNHKSLFIDRNSKSLT